MECKRDSKDVNIVLCCSGSVASIKIPELVIQLVELANVRIIATTRAKHFLKEYQQRDPCIWNKFLEVGGFSLFVTDDDEWGLWNNLGDPVLHIELRKWADLLVVAPASADLIAKASVGISDNLVLCVMRAWDFAKPCILCPAMNTVMYDHPATSVALDRLKSWGYEVVGPVIKLLACNERGNGALASVSDIVYTVKENIKNIVSSSHYSAREIIYLPQNVGGRVRAAEQWEDGGDFLNIEENRTVIQAEHDKMARRKSGTGPKSKVTIALFTTALSLSAFFAYCLHNKWRKKG